ncbi:LysE/ArgO family amino acid transporter [Bacillus mojavensis]|uniref:LysE/ArgO family amino acid transporter n=1 Tax=Bacillus mojavensis TaxID=72360 RepID=UPI002DB60ECF|nr:LysE/ArgO family amino acid transporter [Bacillus mojavensis]MEC1292289.1 LysE/ArgO family amino acid transporter [Bacillus mojavensis]MEC1705773.1 LysE/ArgO family amino acid transporter [Bacillus mojavensis]MEC5249116.1 LysE/ArgO family amino acid transporter [Bacillus mojavensis]
MNAMIHGIVLAFGLILPLGAQNVFIFQQGAWQRHIWRALPAIISASVCDTLLIVLAVAGVSVIVQQLPMFETVMMTGGFLFLLYMGWVTWNSRPKANQNEKHTFTAKKQAAFAAAVSLLNPHAILDTIGIIGTSSLQYSGLEKWLFMAACIAVSWIWFISLALAGQLFQTIDTNGRLMLIVNKCSAVVLWAAAVNFLFSIFR